MSAQTVTHVTLGVTPRRQSPAPDPSRTRTEGSFDGARRRTAAALAARPVPHPRRTRRRCGRPPTGRSADAAAWRACTTASGGCCACSGSRSTAASPRRVAAHGVRGDSTTYVAVPRHLGDPGPDPTVRVERRRDVEPGLVRERYTISSTAAEPVACTLGLLVGADLAPLDGVKGGTGRPAVAPDGVGGHVLTWQQDSLRAVLRLPGARTTARATTPAPPGTSSYLRASRSPTSCCSPSTTPAPPSPRRAARPAGAGSRWTAPTGGSAPVRRAVPRRPAAAAARRAAARTGSRRSSSAQARRGSSPSSAATASGPRGCCCPSPPTWRCRPCGCSPTGRAPAPTTRPPRSPARSSTRSAPPASASTRPTTTAATATCRRSTTAPSTRRRCGR